jgi:hypothetical protein
MAKPAGLILVGLIAAAATAVIPVVAAPQKRSPSRSHGAAASSIDSPARLYDFKGVPLSDVGSIGEQEMLTILKKYEAFRPADEFSPSPIFQNLVGRPFRIAIPVRKAGGGDVATWSYDADEQTLNLYRPEASWKPLLLYKGGHSEGPGALDYAAGVSLVRIQIPPTKYIGVNTFGAKVTVTKQYSMDYGLSFAEGFNYDNIKKGFESIVPLPVKLPSAMARQVTQDIKFVMEGTLRDGPTGPTACGIDHDKPTIGVPKENFKKFCILFANLHREAFETGPESRVLWEQIFP